MRQWIAAYTLANFTSVKVICGILGKLDRGNFELIGRSEIVTGHKIGWEFAVNRQNKTIFRHFRDWYSYLTEIGVSARAFYTRNFCSPFL